MTLISVVSDSLWRQPDKPRSSRDSSANNPSKGRANASFHNERDSASPDGTSLRSMKKHGYSTPRSSTSSSTISSMHKRRDSGPGDSISQIGTNRRRKSSRGSGSSLANKAMIPYGENFETSSQLSGHSGSSLSSGWSESTQPFYCAQNKMYLRERLQCVWRC
ncbi:hypothetical protein AMS68_002784 [Peltaster fructicola]|uniref:Uncharacterized protein n=1 Tax=Peltaster fructicola TaxID=286661 RepID=A0A6H0XR85_9PEZI|nr:hypothetical protein AMS68_002784 [Peltaster fructicola]